MAEIDYQMALLLQHRFEQEHRSLSDIQKSDQQLAQELQQQFEQEDAVERPSAGLVYKHPKGSHNSLRSLIDPSWELVDPTPDIHTLFMVFNERFFWNKLLAVCVSWSKRMTSCAGICSYNGRGGMCSITLSEPLLKLRPRKDLVETLLHEMIHAYLFVTHNNKDRDGHGPEFHKHMFRINKESGTNITVYHDFHDEVRLYKQHWWRCNGPCQHQKPYFGMVRRATNRAPGPNDRWWAEHSRNCGGTFIKVKEPEKNPKTTKKPEAKTVSTVKSKDIRSFLTPSVKSGDSSNIKGFKDLTNRVKGKYNSSSTIVVTKNSTANSNNENTFKPTVFNAGTTSTKKTEGENVKPAYSDDFLFVRNYWAGTNSSKKSEGENAAPQYSDDFLSVRNHWVDKFSNSKKRSSSEEPSCSSKIQRVSESTTTSDTFCECPVCNKRMLMINLNTHLDVCLNESNSDQPADEEKKECPLCNSMVPSSSFDVHVEKCVMKVYDGIERKLDDNATSESVSCLACGKKILKSDLNTYLEDCMINIFDEDFDDDKSEVKNVKKEVNSEFNCPFCMKLVEESEMKMHLDACLKSDIDITAIIGDDF